MVAAPGRQRDRRGAACRGRVTAAFKMPGRRQSLPRPGHVPPELSWQPRGHERRPPRTTAVPDLHRPVAGSGRCPPSPRRGARARPASPGRPEGRTVAGETDDRSIPVDGARPRRPPFSARRDEGHPSRTAAAFRLSPCRPLSSPLAATATATPRGGGRGQGPHDRRHRRRTQSSKDDASGRDQPKTLVSETWTC